MAENSLKTFEEFLAEDEWVYNHDFDKETLPNHPWFATDSTYISSKLGEASTKIINALGTFPKNDVELRHLERNALDLRQVSRGPAKKIFFMGAAGVGKPSLFNALFNRNGIAKTGAKGDACTCVVVRYTASSRDTDGYNVITQFSKPSAIKNLITEHAKSYHERHFSTPISENEDDNDVDSADVKQAETARKFFSLIFEDDENFRACLTPRTYEDGSFETLCLEKCLAKLSAVGVNQETFTKQQYFGELEEMLEAIEGCISDVKDKECFWHLVDNVEDDADLLCAIGDTDRIRADALIVDCAIRGLEQHGSEKGAMIATKIDVLVDNDMEKEPGVFYERARSILNWIKIPDELAAQIPEDLKALADRNLAERMPQLKVFSVSSAQYMKWVEEEEFLYDQSPELTAEASGIPDLRRHILTLAAEQNYEAYNAHLSVFFPALVAKIDRVHAETEFTTVLDKYCEAVEDQGLQPLLEDHEHYVTTGLNLLAEQWHSMRYPTFRKTMNEYGILLPGMSKTPNFKRGFNINKLLAKMLTPAFKRLAREQKPVHQKLGAMLHDVRTRVIPMVHTQMDSADSDLRSIEEAKKRWASRSLGLTALINSLVARMDSMSDALATLATREEDQRSFIARLTRATYEQVRAIRPEKIERTSKKRKGEVRTISVYERPIGVFYKERLLKLLREGADPPGDDAKLEHEQEHDDIVRKIMVRLDANVQKRYRAMAADLLLALKAVMGEFLAELRDLAPSDVQVSEQGRAARERLAALQEELGGDCAALQELLPAVRRE
ncbi:hypothetical protein BDV95DRAFT_603908 [Massariosphaeria phaeospora]|uniref:P-loop containing nucleoside triphosphate hydrolase protein n=1 Tax=Massariosphaeria phaeospora TaxID=100035 RepID=A0A7C8MER5_9PLEO|nr:hypothetical protein BDV95DRAFT_603908 [Massariosphaeria phaeospora]